jgi:flap endonuclease-1
MGVKLQELVASNNIEIKQLAGKIIAIDAPNIIMSLFNFAYKNQSYSYSNLMTDCTQRVISHLYGLLFRINFYYSKNMFPIFCFDGKDSELKRIITKDQLNDFLVTTQWYQKALKSGNKEEARKIAMSHEFLWPNIIKESKQLLGALGVPYIESPASAESQCAQLVKDGIASYANSQDYDTLLFGCPKVLQNLSKSQKRKIQGKWKYKKVIPRVADLQYTLRKLAINQFQLVDMSILMGTDYFSGIRNIGPKTALLLITKYGSLEKIIAKEKNTYDFSPITPGLLKKIRKIFLLPEVLNTSQKIYWTSPNKMGIADLMCYDHHLNKERVDNNINKLAKNYSKCRHYFKTNPNGPNFIQTTLDMSI